jgi:hypothetical protein
VVTRISNKVTFCVHRLSFPRHFQGLAEQEPRPILLGSLSYGMQYFVFGYWCFEQHIDLREILLGMFGRWKGSASPLNMERKCPDPSLTSNQSRLHNTPEERRSQIHYGRRLKCPSVL